jgi:hypothetical protein
VQAAALEERCQQLRVAAAERDYDTLTADCSKRERDAAAVEPFSTYREQIGFGPCPIFPRLVTAALKLWQGAPTPSGQKKKKSNSSKKLS